MSSSEKLRYPYNWGRTQVQGFVEKYARGTYFLAKIVGCSPGEIRHGLIMTLCRGSSVRFESLKRVIKYLDIEDAGVYDRYTEVEQKLLYKYYLYLAENEYLDEKKQVEALDTARSFDLGF